VAAFGPEHRTAVYDPAPQSTLVRPAS
jgi:hypothetical protein